MGTGNGAGKLKPKGDETMEGTSEAMQARTRQFHLQELQKEQENDEQMRSLETFKALLQKAAQV
jgi:hypothetical protein